MSGFLNEERISFDLSIDSFTRISKMLISNEEESSSCSSNDWILIHDAKHFNTPMNNISL